MSAEIRFSKPILRSQGAVGAGILFIALAFVFYGCSPSPGPPAGEKGLAGLCEEAERLAHAGRPRGAAELLEKGLGDDPDRGAAGLYGKIAGYYLTSGSNQAALRYCAQALSGEERNPDVLAVKGEAQRRLVDLDGSRETLSEALRLAPGHPRASLSMARLKFRVEKPGDSLALFETFLSGAIKPGDDALSLTARLEYGRALRAAGRHQEAADQLAVLLEAEPTRSESYSELAAALYRLRRREEARFIEGIYKTLSQGSFEEYGVDKMRMQGREAQALAQQASNRQRERRFLDAFHSHRNACAANQGDARIPGLYARYCLGFRRIDEGLEIISAAIATGCKPLSGLLWERGRLESGRRNWQAAAAAFRSTLQAIDTESGQDADRPQRPGQANRFSAFLGLSRSLIESGEYEQAREIITKAARLSPAAWEPSYWRGRGLLASGDPAAALAAFEDARRLCRSRGDEPGEDLKVYTAVANWRASGDAAAGEEIVARLAQAPGQLDLYAELASSAVKDAGRRAWARKTRAEMVENQEKIERLEARLQKRSLEESAGIYIELADAYSKFRERAAYDYLFLASDLDPANTPALKRLLSIRASPQEVFFRLRLLRRLLAAEPSSEGALYGIAEIFMKLHVRLEEARKLVAAGVRSHPDSARLRSLRERLSQ